MKAIVNDVVQSRFRGRLEQTRHLDDPSLEIFHAASAVFYDMMTAFIFGRKNGTDFTSDDLFGGVFFDSHNNRQKYGFWASEMPSVTKLLHICRLEWLIYPRSVQMAWAEEEKWTQEMCKKAENARREAQDQPEEAQPLYSWFKRTHGATAQSTCRCLKDSSCAHILCEMLDHTIAGFYTTSITMAWIALEMSRPENIHWQARVREELISSDVDLLNF